MSCVTSGSEVVVASRGVPSSLQRQVDFKIGGIWTALQRLSTTKAVFADVLIKFLFTQPPHRKRVCDWTIRLVIHIKASTACFLVTVHAHTYG